MAKIFRRLKNIKIKGLGLIKGLDVTGRIFFRKNITEDYPNVRPEISDNWRGTLDLNADDCIACNLCSIDCPNQAIQIITEKDEDNKKKLVSFKINFAYCMFCGLCVENCPKKCLKFTKDFETATYDKKDVIKDMINDRSNAEESKYGQPKAKVIPKVKQEEAVKEEGKE